MPIALFLSGLALFSCGETQKLLGPAEPASYDAIALQKAEDAIPLQEDVAKTLKNIALDDPFQCKQRRSNWVFSPASYELCLGLEQSRYGELSGILSSMNLENEQTSIATKAVVASTKEIAPQHIESIRKSGASIFLDPSLPALSEKVSAYLDEKIVVPDIDLFFAGQITLSDTFATPFFTASRAFLDKQVPFATANRNIGYAENEFGIAFSFKVNASSLSFFLPNAGVELSSCDLSYLFAEKKETGLAGLALPKFRLSSMLMKSSVPGENIIQKSAFSFDEKGVEGKSTTLSGPTSSGNETRPTPKWEINLDRPFYFASCYDDAPMFLGAVYSI